MKKFYTASIILFVCAATFSGVYKSASKEFNRTAQRAVSLSPSITEAIYFLGEWDKVIAVSRYCVYPPEANDKPKVGGIQDVNYEAVLSLKPDLVIVSHMQIDAKERFESLGINTLLVDQESLEGMINSLHEIGKALGAEKRATALVDELNSSIDNIINKIESCESKRVLFVVSRDAGNGRIANVVVAGNDGYYSRALELLRADNPFSKYVTFSTVSKEGLYKVDPEVIIELLYTPSQASAALDEWGSMPSLTAVKNGRICSITDSYGYIQGPRFPLLLEEASRCIYPEAFQ